MELEIQHGGTGGLLIIYSNNIVNNKNIISNGSASGISHSDGTGGGSGAGTINLFYRNTYTNKGTLQANGGTGKRTSSVTWHDTDGGTGGNGSISVGNISSGTYVSTYTNY